MLIKTIGNTAYTVKGFYQEEPANTAHDKLLRLMKFELENENNSCYNHYNTNSQNVPQRNAAAVGGFCEAKLLKSLDCKPERSIV